MDCHLPLKLDMAIDWHKSKSILFLIVNHKCVIGRLKVIVGELGLLIKFSLRCSAVNSGIFALILDGFALSCSLLKGIYFHDLVPPWFGYRYSHLLLVALLDQGWEGEA